MVDRHPDQLSGFCLFHSTPLSDSAERKEVRNKVIESVETNGVVPFIKTFVPGLFVDPKNPAVAKIRLRALQTKPEILIGYSIAMRDRPDRSDVLRKTSLPGIIIGGLEDALIRIESLREWALLTNKYTIYELENVAHMGIFEAKTECQSIIEGFTKELLLIK